MNPWRPASVQVGMAQGLLPYEVVTEAGGGGVTGRAGLPLVAETMRGLRVGEAVEQHVGVGQRESGFGDVEKVEAIVLLLSAGGDCLDDIRHLAADEGLLRLLGRSKLPSPDVLRRFLYAFHDERLMAEAERRREARREQVLLPEESAPLRGLARVNRALVHAVAAQSKLTRATLDHDATIQESHKREAKAHYKGGKGYQPSAIYWAEQDLVVGDEYRDGNVPAAMGNLRLIREAFATLPAQVTERYFRADSACYEQAVLRWLADENRDSGPAGRIGFSVSADMTRELREACAHVEPTSWDLVEERASETVEVADVEFTSGNWAKDAAPLRYVAMRMRAKQGRLFADGNDTRYLAVVTNRRELSARQVVRWHWEKAGTIEHVHDVTKNELGAGTPPCGRFGANAAWYRLSLLTYNVLSAMKSLALPPAMTTARPKRLRFALFSLAGRISSHAGQLWLRVSEAAERLAGLISAREKLRALLVPAPA